MLEVKKITKNNRVQKQTTYIKEKLTQKTAEKKQAILDIISEGTQLSLLGKIVEQLGDKAELDTPEFHLAKALFAQINTILEK